MVSYEYEFERMELTAGGYSLFGGVGNHLEGHREVILRRGRDGWRYVGFLPTAQRATGHVETVDLVFERPASADGQGSDAP